MLYTIFVEAYWNLYKRQFQWRYRFYIPQTLNVWSMSPNLGSRLALWGDVVVSYSYTPGILNLSLQGVTISIGKDRLPTIIEGWTVRFRDEYVFLVVCKGFMFTLWGNDPIWLIHIYIYILDLPPHPVTVTTRIVTFLVRNPYKPLFATFTGWGYRSNLDIFLKSDGKFKHQTSRAFISSHPRLAWEVGVAMLPQPSLARRTQGERLENLPLKGQQNSWRRVRDTNIYKNYNL